MTDQQQEPVEAEAQAPEAQAPEEAPEAADPTKGPLPVSKEARDELYGEQDETEDEADES